MAARILVTGGSGFVGSHVVDGLLAAGYEPRIFDIVPSAHHPARSVDTYLGDVSDGAALRDAMVDCDAVIHLAAIADVSQVAIDPIFAEQVNAGGTLRVLEAAREAGVSRVLYASTIWVYGDTNGDRVDEASPLVGLPRHPYTATKIAGEMYCSSHAELYGTEFTILRFGIPYGPRARPAAVVPQFVRRALAGEPLSIAGSGRSSRRFIYVEDLARGCIAALAPQASNRVYNLVGDEDVTILQIAEHVRDLIGSVEIVHTEGRVGDFAGAQVSAARAGRELGWCAPTTFAEGLRAYASWHIGEAASVGGAQEGHVV
jgi:UDP-glucose 4-epimerase